VANTSFSSALPAQLGNEGKFITTDGTDASWGMPVIPSQVEAEGGTDNAKYMTALRTAQQITAKQASQVQAETATDNATLMTPLRTAQSINTRFDNTAPVTQAFGDAAAPGASTQSARRDHKHGFPAAASQSDMETATSTTTIVTPAKTQYHPGVCKAWVKCGNTGNILASHNVSGVVDVGVGLLVVNTNTDFSSASYVINVSIQASAAYLANVDSTTDPVATGFKLQCLDLTAVPIAYIDPEAWHIACFGDQ
jgi:hypothetical protein